MSSFKSIVLPDDLERKNFSIVIEVLLEPIVGMSTAQFNLNILFVFFGIWRVDLGVFGTNESLEKISGKTFRFVQWTIHIIVELFCEGIAIINSEDTFEDVEVNCDVEILPSIMVSKLSDDLGYFLPLQEHSLRDTCVLYFLLGDVDGFV